MNLAEAVEDRNREAPLSSDHKGRAGAAIAIGVTTFNRLEQLKVFVEAVRKHTAIPYDLVVADDGSQDETVGWCRSEDLTVLGGSNKGIAWNKNRALYTLMRYSMAGVVVLFDDDCFPDRPDWAERWVAAAERWGHVNALHPSTMRKLAEGEPSESIHGGSGTPDDPFECDHVSGMCIASSRTALCRVGFMDSRFKGYGHEHSEWTLRFNRHDYGIRRRHIGGVKRSLLLQMGYGLATADLRSASNKSNAKANRELMQQLKKEDTYRLPWQTDKEKRELLSEVAEGVWPPATVSATPRFDWRRTVTAPFRSSNQDG